MAENMQNVANERLKELTIQHQGKKWTKSAKRQKTDSLGSLGGEVAELSLF